ncbi:uncharacterized protein LOC115318411 [Ixodes scapularis]|uniref:uncharacterized protein LOC115318411 n=1 Tax=Ixodes scapularis TaxID=6945 RepID=UPI001A9EA013|nr:uncharacterized protein LOC115318411 [Ixodes scapularis]
MPLFPLTVTVLLVLLHSTSARKAYMERNPALQEYQNQSSCFPLEETWHMAYRNYEFDPAMGYAARCVRYGQTRSGRNGRHPVILTYKPNVVIDLTVTLRSTPGYTAKNVMNFHPRGCESFLSAYSVYKDNKKGNILRVPYAGEGACALLVPKSQLGNHSVCCDFIFDLLCGSGTKFNISDSSCP